MTNIKTEELKLHETLNGVEVSYRNESVILEAMNDHKRRGMVFFKVTRIGERTRTHIYLSLDREMSKILGERILQLARLAEAAE